MSTQCLDGGRERKNESEKERRKAKLLRTTQNEIHEKYSLRKKYCLALVICCSGKIANMSAISRHKLFLRRAIQTVKFVKESVWYQ